MTSVPLSGILLLIQREYEEQPGLRLTSFQAQRLWGLDGSTCSIALAALVDAGTLQRTTDGRFAIRQSAP
jgi:hypothetical protein